jgi:hypothetical protein
VGQERPFGTDGEREDGVATRAREWRWTQAAREEKRELHDYLHLRASSTRVAAKSEMNVTSTK